MTNEAADRLRIQLANDDRVPVLESTALLDAALATEHRRTVELLRDYLDHQIGCAHQRIELAPCRHIDLTCDDCGSKVYRLAGEEGSRPTPEPAPAPWEVHGHGPHQGPGSACVEYRLNGRLVGACKIAAMTGAAPPDPLSVEALLRDACVEVVGSWFDDSSERGHFSPTVLSSRILAAYRLRASSRGTALESSGGTEDG